jgi:hypothetical protein
MPRPDPKLAFAKQRVAHARLIVEAQRSLIAKLALGSQGWIEAQGTLQSLESSLKHLEDHEQKLRAKRRSTLGETRKKDSG